MSAVCWCRLDGGTIVDGCPRGSGVGAASVPRALKGVVVSPHPLELSVSSFSPSRFQAAADPERTELLCNALFFLRPSSSRIGY